MANPKSFPDHLESTLVNDQSVDVDFYAQMRSMTMGTSETTAPDTVPTLTASDRAIVMYVAGLLRAAVLRRVGEDADRIAERLIARMAATAEVTGACTVKMRITGDRIAATAMATLPTSTPVVTPPGAVRLVPMARASMPVPVLDEPPPILLTTMMAAKLLGCSVKALYHRVAERQIPSSCVVRAGRRILFHRAKLIEAMDRRAGR